MTCTAFRDWVLGAAWSADLKLNMDVAPPKLCNMLTAAVQLHARRAELYTHVQLVQNSPNEAAAFLAVRLLQESDIKHLYLQVLRHVSISNQAAFLLATAAALPHLQGLYLDELNAPLPSPEQLPHLTQLSATMPADPDTYIAVISSIAPHLTQLTHLNLDHAPGIGHEQQWHLLFVARSTTLTEFSTDAMLVDPLLALLVRQCPNLSDINVYCVCLQSDQCATATWAVKSITTSAEDLEWLELSCLPLTTAATLHIYLTYDRTDTKFYVRQGGLTREGFNAQLLARFPCITLCGLDEVRLNGAELAEEDEVPAVTACIQQLTALSVETTRQLRLALESFTWRPALFQALRAAMAALPQYALRLRLDELDDALVDTLVRHAPPQHQLSVEAVSLESDAHSSAPWPWAWLKVCGAFDLENLVLFPDPEGAVRSVEMKEEHFASVCLCLDTEQVAAGLPTKLIQRLQHLEFSAETRVVVQLIAPDECPADQQPALLRMELEVLRALRMAAGTKCAVKLVGWLMTEAVAAELAGLPEWVAELMFHSLQWVHNGPVIDAEGSLEVARFVPASCPLWTLCDTSLGARVISLLQGVGKYRAVERGPLKVYVEVEGFRETCKGSVRTWDLESYVVIVDSRWDV